MYFWFFTDTERFFFYTQTRIESVDISRVNNQRVENFEFQLEVNYTINFSLTEISDVTGDVCCLNYGIFFKILF